MRKTVGIEEVVVDPAIDHIHPLQALGRLHADDVVLHHEILAHDDLDAHRAGEEGVLEIGGVVDAGREQHDRRLVRIETVRRGDVAQEIEQLLAVVTDRAHFVPGEELAENALHHFAVFQHVAHSRGAAAVVLEHEIVAVASRIRSLPQMWI